MNPHWFPCLIDRSSKSREIRRLTSQLPFAPFYFRMSLALQFCVRNIKGKFDPLPVAPLALQALQTTRLHSVASTQICIQQTVRATEIANNICSFSAFSVQLLLAAFYVDTRASRVPLSLLTLATDLSHCLPSTHSPAPYSLLA